jgi:citrate lyase gamma subunit
MEIESQQIRTGPGGEQTIDVVVRSSIERLVGNGQMDKILSPYAMRRQVAY